MESCLSCQLRAFSSKSRCVQFVNSALAPFSFAGNAKLREESVSKNDKNDKKDKKEKKDKKDKGKKHKVKPSQIKTPDSTMASGSSYADGTPLDRVQYLEAKLILKPDRFTSVESFRDFGKIVQRTAKKVGVGFITDAQTGLRPEIREILFGDTPDFRLYNNAFILRRRVSYVDGFPVGDPEIVFKYRHPEEQEAAA